MKIKYLFLTFFFIPLLSFAQSTEGSVLFLNSQGTQSYDSLGLHYFPSSQSLSVGTSSNTSLLNVGGTAQFDKGIGLYTAPAPKSALTITNPEGPAMTIQSPTNSNQTSMFLFKQPDGMVKTAINSVGAYYSNAWMVLSGEFRASQDANGNVSFTDGYTGIPAMLDIRSDVTYALISKSYNADDGSLFLGIDRKNNYTINIDQNGKVSWGANVKDRSLMDTNLYRSNANTLKTDGKFIAGGLESIGDVTFDSIATTTSPVYYMLTIDNAGKVGKIAASSTGNSVPAPAPASTSPLGGNPGYLLFSDANKNIAGLPDVYYNAQNQYLGIGTTTPKAKVHISGQYVGLTLDNNGAYQMLDNKGIPKNIFQLDSGNNIHLGNADNAIYIRNAKGKSTRILNGDSTVNLFQVFDNGMITTSGGNFGIGVVTPTQALDVNGNVKVGSNTKRSGIILYDDITGNPYCVKIKDGILTSAPGSCN